jgi:hypothetical protein
VWCFGRVAATGLPIGSRRFARACEKLPADTLIDGEVIVVGENGGCAFKRFAAQASKGSYPTLCLRSPSIHLCMAAVTVLRLLIEERRQ